MPHLILLQDGQLHCLGEKVISYRDGLFPWSSHSECTSDLIDHGAFIVTDANALINFYSNKAIINFDVSERAPSMGIADLRTHFRRVVHKDLPLGGVPTIDATVSLTFRLSRDEAGLPVRKVYKASQRIDWNFQDTVLTKMFFSACALKPRLHNLGAQLVEDDGPPRRPLAVISNGQANEWVPSLARRVLGRSRR